MARHPAPKRRKTRRRIKTPKSESASQRQARTAIAYIMQNPHYDAILRLIRTGAPNSKIAEHLITMGIFEVNQKTAVGYLQYFKKAQPGLCKPVEVDEEQEGIPSDYLDRMFDPSFTVIDEETELIRLINVQKARLGIGFQNERQIAVLMRDNRREVEELRNLIVDLAKVRGKLGSSLDVNLHGYSEGVKDELKSIQQDEQQRNMIATLVADLASM